MPSPRESIRQLVDNVKVLDKHFSLTTHRVIEAVSRGDARYPTLLLGLAVIPMYQWGLSNEECTNFLDQALLRLAPREKVEYDLIGYESSQKRLVRFQTFSDKVRAAMGGEGDAALLFHEIIASNLLISGYRSEVIVNVLDQGTINLINWRDTLLKK